MTARQALRHALRTLTYTYRQEKAHRLTQAASTARTAADGRRATDNRHLKHHRTAIRDDEVLTDIARRRQDNQ